MMMTIQAFILREMAPNNGVLLWLMNHIRLPIVNKILHKGDMHVYSRSDIQRLCDASGMKLELFEIRKGLRQHCLVRKPV